jgi:RNA polymerase sigma factor (sigma-70 family)
MDTAIALTRLDARAFAEAYGSMGLIAHCMEASMSAATPENEAIADAIELDIWATEGGFIPKECIVPTVANSDQNPKADTAEKRIRLTDDLGSLDQAAAERFYNEWLPRSISYCKRLRQELDVNECQDIAHDVMVKILKGRQHFDNAENQTKYVYGVLRYACYDHFEFRKALPHQLCKDFDKEGNCRDEIGREVDVKEAWSRILDDLSPKERTIIRLLRLNKSSKEISKSLGLPVRTVNRRIQKIMGKLCTTLGLPLSKRRATRIVREQSGRSQEA